MPRRNLSLGLLLLCGLLSSGCSSARRPAADRLIQSLFPGLSTAPAGGLDALYAQHISLPAAPRLALFWFDEAGTLPDAERTRLLQQVQRGISQPPLSVVTAPPTIRMASFTQSSMLDLDALRTAAARFQTDVLVLILTRTDAFSDWNLLSLSYLALLPIYFAPGNDLTTYVTAEACAVDVRTGVFLGCAQGNGAAARRFVTPLGVDGRQRELVATATTEALRRLPQQLADIVVARLEPVGAVYATE